MAGSTGVRVLQNFACYWPGVVLLSLFASTTQEATRHFISTQGLWSYLGLWLLAVAPSPLAAFVAARMSADQSG